MRKIALYLLLTFAGCVANPSPQRMCTQKPESQEVLLVALKKPTLSLHWAAAHRGLHDVAFGNTIEALTAAAHAGVPLVEFDVRATADGKLVLFHDRVLKAEQLKSGKQFAGREISSLTLKQIDTIVLDDSVDSKIPTLKQALRALKPYSSLILPELKGLSEKSARQFVKILQEEKFSKRAIVQCSDLKALELFHRIAPNLMTMARIYTPSDLKKVLKLKPRIIQLDEEWVSEDTLNRIQRGGAQSMVKTLDELGDTPAHRTKLLEKGVDIILTDFPLGMC